MKTDNGCSIEALVTNTDWSYDDELGLLQDDISTIGDQLRVDETKKMIAVIEVSDYLYWRGHWKSGSDFSCFRGQSNVKYRSLSRSH